VRLTLSALSTQTGLVMERDGQRAMFVMYPNGPRLALYGVKGTIASISVIDNKPELRAQNASGGVWHAP